MAIKLSILIPSVHERRNTFLLKSLDQLYGQYERLSKEDQKKVEILYLIDNKKQMLGYKRNRLIEMAQGDYVVFVDDDDRISDHYIKKLLKAIELNSDVITFQVSVSINGEKSKICYYSIKHATDRNTETAYYRLPNHICCIKRSIAEKITFPNIKYGEDATYSKLIKPYLKIEHNIKEILYYYDFNSETTIAQEDRDMKRFINKRSNPVMDVIILSNAKNAYLKSLTDKTIQTCISGANGMPINIIIVEQNKNVKYRHKTIYNTKKFNYNKFANQAIRECKSEWIMIANNDLIFHNGWLHELLAANYPVVSPKCPRDKRQANFSINTLGVKNARHFSGWCFAMKRQIWEKIGGFDEDVNFWCSDDVILEQIQKIGLRAMIVPKSLVTHLGSSTLITESKEDKEKLTYGQLETFNKKYRQNKIMSR